MHLECFQMFTILTQVCIIVCSYHLGLIPQAEIPFMFRMKTTIYISYFLHFVRWILQEVDSSSYSHQQKASTPLGIVDTFNLD